MSETKTQPESAVDVLVPPIEEKVLTIGTGDLEYTFVQRPLNFFQKMELFGVLGRAMDQAMSGPNAISIEALLEVPGARGKKLTPADFKEADLFMRAIFKLVGSAPDLLKELYPIFLGVPRGQRELVVSIMELPQDDGGMTDEQGTSVLETFVDQNWDALVDFFSERIRPLVEKVSQKVQGSQPSKPSKATRQRTAKQ